jgi:hypothetical protein
VAVSDMVAVADMVAAANMAAVGGSCGLWPVAGTRGKG